MFQKFDYAKCWTRAYLFWTVRDLLSFLNLPNLGKCLMIISLHTFSSLLCFQLLNLNSFVPILYEPILLLIFPVIFPIVQIG